MEMAGRYWYMMPMLSRLEKYHFGRNDARKVTFSYDGKTAFVCNGDDNTVSAIDVATKTVTKTIAVGANPVGAWTGAAIAIM
ncbi:MAG: hypothetical protein IPK11_15445 [Ignavibacteria bacterium]|nr:hypothetical protein [Ignavibacteria bacterium]